MIKHIVMWRLHPEAGGRSAVENGQELKRRLEALVGQLPEIAELEVGLNLNQGAAAFDVVLYSVFNDAEALAAYQEHPEHQALLGFVRSIASDRGVVDYEL